MKRMYFNLLLILALFVGFNPLAYSDETGVGAPGDSDPDSTPPETTDAITETGLIHTLMDWFELEEQ